MQKCLKGFLQSGVSRQVMRDVSKTVQAQYRKLEPKVPFHVSDTWVKHIISYGLILYLACFGSPFAWLATLPTAGPCFLALSLSNPATKSRCSQLPGFAALVALTNTFTNSWSSFAPSASYLPAFFPTLFSLIPRSMSLLACSPHLRPYLRPSPRASYGPHKPSH